MPRAQECVGQPRHGWAGQRALCLGRLASVPGGRRPPAAGRAQRKCVPIYACTRKMDLGSPHFLPQMDSDLSIPIQAVQILGFDCTSILSAVSRIQTSSSAQRPRWRAAYGTTSSRCRSRGAASCRCGQRWRRSRPCQSTSRPCTRCSSSGAPFVYVSFSTACCVKCGHCPLSWQRCLPAQGACCRRRPDRPGTTFLIAGYVLYCACSAAR